MSCCGGKRAQFIQVKYETQSESARRESRLSTREKVARFERTGGEPFGVHGIVTGKYYSFTGHGEVVEVDMRDVHSLLPFAHLRQR